MAGGLEVHADARAAQQLYADLRAAGSDLKVELRRGVKKAADPVVQGIKAGAPSARIARSIKPKVSFTQRSASVSVIADAKIAANAAPINNKGKPGKFRHEVFGHDVWVDQAADPFFDDPVRANRERFFRSMEQVVDEVARKAGYR